MTAFTSRVINGERLNAGCEASTELIAAANAAVMHLASLDEAVCQWFKGPHEDDYVSEARDARQRLLNAIEAYR